MKKIEERSAYKTGHDAHAWVIILIRLTGRRFLELDKQVKDDLEERIMILTIKFNPVPISHNPLSALE